MQTLESDQLTERQISATVRPYKLWMPSRVIFTAEAFELPYGKEIFEKASSLGVAVQVLKNNRITGIRGTSERDTYKTAKSTLSVVVAPPSAFKLRPIPPSADYQFHLAEGCPAHCQYCYLAGSLQGPPIIRVFANLPEILENLRSYEKEERPATFEASCYTDPLSIEHITGGLKRTITFFGQEMKGHLRFVTKFDSIDPLIDIAHRRHTRFRMSLNAYPVSKRLETGTPGIDLRITALRRMALPVSSGGGGYPIGVVLAPIIPIEGWMDEYDLLLVGLKESLDFECDLTFELITHRFTEGSKSVLNEWYPNTSLDMDEANRTKKQNKFGGSKFVFQQEKMKNLKLFFEQRIALHFPKAKILYWT